MKNIVVLGGGFGGLSTAIKLGKELKKLPQKKDYRLILIDKSDHHVFIPLLYEISTASKETADYIGLKSLVTYPLKELLLPFGGEFINDEVLHVDTEESKVHLKTSGKISFDYLVLALGSETNYFGIPGLKENSFSLKSFDEAIMIRDALWFAASESNGKSSPVRVVVGGGGSTGVELAGEIKEAFCKFAEEEMKCKSDITLVEGGNSVLGSFVPKIQKIATNHLKKIGVKIMTGKRVIEIKKNKMIFETGENIPFDILIWTGGIKAVSLTEKLNLKTMAGGRMQVLDGMECLDKESDLKIVDGIYAIGDITCIFDPKTKKPMPSIAPIAIEEGKIVAKNIIERIKENNNIIKKARKYVYPLKEYPYVIPIGGKFAIAKIGSFVFSGFPAWVFKGCVDFYYLISIMPFFKAFKIWLKGLIIFAKNDRLG